jgi:protein gp37
MGEDWPDRTQFKTELYKELTHWKTTTPRNLYRRGEGSKPLAFVCDTGDLFHPSINKKVQHNALDYFEARKDVDWILLTKRAELMRRNILSWLRKGIGRRAVPENIWLMVTAENQEMADRRIPKLLSIPSSGMLGISFEPLLGEITLKHLIKETPSELDWVIIGGESGRKARKMDSNWAFDLMAQCIWFGIPYHFKQWGEFNQAGERVGRWDAGHLVNGEEHLGFPM